MAHEPEISGGGSHFHQAVQLLTRRSGRAAQIARALIVGAAVYELGGKAFKKGRDLTIYSVAVPDDDDVYDDLHAWLVENLPARRRRALTARTKRRSRNDQPVLVDDDDDDDTARLPPPRIRLSYDGSKAQAVTIDGHRVRVEVEQHGKRPGGNLSESQMQGWLRDPERLIFRATGAAARDAVLGLIEDIASTRDDNTRSRFFMPRWGGWHRRNDLPLRTLDTVILRAGQREGIVADLTEFFDAEDRYARVGLPWHRGYVLQGPPGTGKTSMAKALAEHFELDLYFIPLSDLESDTNLLQLFASVEPRSMLVLEDIDIVHGAKSRDDAESTKAVTLSGLLNALDGLATPHGLITFMTTNDIAVLDPALLRPGRADRIEELGYLDDDQLRRLCSLVTGRDLSKAVAVPSIPEGVQLTHAEVIEAAKPHLDKPRVAVEEISRCVTRKRLTLTRPIAGHA